MDKKAYFESVLDELIEAYLEENPNATEDEAYAECVEEASSLTLEMQYEYADWERDQQRDRLTCISFLEEG